MKSKSLTLWLSMALLSGCTAFDVMKQNSEEIDKEVHQKDHLQLDFGNKQKSPVVLEDEGLWVSSASIPVIAEKPKILEKKIELSKGRIGLDEIAEEITRRLNIPVHLGAEIVLAMKGSVDQGSSEDNNKVQVPLINSSVYYTSLTYSGSLERLLETLAARMNISWEIKNGELKLFRYLTRTFAIAAPHGESGYASAIDVKGASSDEAVTSNSSDVPGASEISAKILATQSPWQSILDVINTIKSPEGQIAVNEAAGTITATDVKIGIERIEEYIKQQNANYLKQVALSISVYSVEKTDDIGYGINWDVVYERLSDYSLSISSPVGAAISGAGSVSALILNDNTDKPGVSSSTLLEALRSQGKVSTITSGSIIALNHRPSSVRLGTSEGYLKSSETTLTTDVGATTALKDGVIETGSVMAVLPNIIDSESMTLQLSINISALEALREFTSNGSSIFAPKKSIKEINNPVHLKTGQTLVLGGLEDHSREIEERNLGESWIAGGGINSRQLNSSIVVVIKPVIL